MIDRSLLLHTGRPSLEDLPLLPCNAWQAAQLAAHLGWKDKNVNNFNTIKEIDLKIKKDMKDI